LCHSSSTTSPTPRVWVPRHIARLIACRERQSHPQQLVGINSY
jgi:hypothetical protein